MTEIKIATAEQMERNLLNAIISDNTSYFEAEQIIQPQYFFNSWNRTIWLSMARLMEEKSPIDEGMLISDLTRNGQLDRAGGDGYVFDLKLSLIPRNPNVAAYALEVKAGWDLRELQRMTYSTALLSDGNNGSFRKLREGLESQLLSHSTDNVYTRDEREADLDELLERLEIERNRTTDILGLPSGIRRLDTLTHGFQKGEITFCGASSGGGKSGFMVQSAIEACKMDVPVLLFSLEMDRAALLRRVLCAVSGVPFPRIRDPRWAGKDDMLRIHECAEIVKRWPLFVIDKSGMSIEQLCATARLYIRRHGVGLVGVDYAQIVGAKERDERLRVSAVSRGLTRLAKDEQVPVLALSQLARPDRREENRPPSQSSLRESSQLENDAHCIVLFHRERDAETGRLKSDGLVRVAKQRNGETADYPVRFDRATLTFSDLEAHSSGLAVAS